MLEVPGAGELQHRQAVRVGDRAHPFDFFGARLDPAGGAKRSMITRCELMARFDIVVKKAAIIHDPRHDFRSGFFCGREAKTTRPRLEWIKDDHGPIDQSLESLEAENQVERKSICRPRGNPEPSG